MMDRWLQRIMMLAVILGMAIPVLAQGLPASPENCLVVAQNSYRNMRLLETIEGLERCRGGHWPDLNRSQTTAAFRLLSLSYFAWREPDSAKNAVMALLEVDRRYRSNPEVDPLFFQYLVSSLRPKAFYQKRWVQIGGGLVIGGIVSCLFARCLTPQPNPLPGPGDFLPSPQ